MFLRLRRGTPQNIFQICGFYGLHVSPVFHIVRLPAQSGLRLRGSERAGKFFFDAGHASRGL